MADNRTKAKKNTKPAEDGIFKKIIAVIAGFAVLVVLELANFNYLGAAGSWMKYALFGLFGVMEYIFPIVLAGIVIYVVLADEINTSVVVGYAVLFVFLCAFARLVSDAETAGPINPSNLLDFFTISAEKFNGGGLIGGLVGFGLYMLLDSAGAIVVIIIVILLCIFIANRRPLTSLLAALFGDEEPYEDKKPKKENASSDKGQRSPEEETGRRRASENIDIKSENDDGTVITIKRRQKRLGRRKTTILIRSKNKAKPLRDGSAQPISGKTKKGIGDNLDFINGESEDEVREITGMQFASGNEIPEPEVSPSPSEIPSGSAEYAEIRDFEEKDKNLKTAGEIRAAEAPSTPVKKAAPSKKENFRTPPMSILRQPPKMKSSKDNLKTTASLLEEVLAQFGVNAKVINAQAGPSVVRYELQPEVGTRVNKITSLADDLKLNLAVPDIRIEAPIPGRAAVGIEVPSKIRQTVYVRELLESKELKSMSSYLAFAAGKDISGNVVTADIAKMPHMLIAGTTGSGKSVFINSILMSILYRTKPSEVGLIIIDPKAVEFSVYKGIPNLIKDVVTDPAQAVSTLRWAVNEMTVRYQRMQLSGVRDFESYNRKFDAGTINPNEENASRMPQILIVIDELADLMMVAAKEAEGLICRLAQLARAAGIHLVIATQRPSVDVVTGLIKANIPARVALLVSSGIDSRTIIDMVGAEKLLGHGDMLFYPTGYVKPVRVQGAYVSDDEIREVVRFLKTQGRGENFYTREAEEIEKYQTGEAAQDSTQAEESSTKDKYDEFFFEAGLLCIEQGKASSSMLQRRFNIGFNRAARIIDQLADFGAVGPANGAKPREILVDSISFREMWDSLE